MIIKWNQHHSTLIYWKHQLQIGSEVISCDIENVVPSIDKTDGNNILSVNDDNEHDSHSDGSQSQKCESEHSDQDNNDIDEDGLDLGKLDDETGQINKETPETHVSKCDVNVPEHKGDVESKNEECEVGSNQDELYSEIPEDKGDVEMTDDQCEVEMREDKCDDQMTNEGHVGPVVNTNGNKLPPPSYSDVLAFKQKLLESSIST